ncbi:hypothetical protein QAD02_001059 [Eretmocerus hayati]|uniref:Uncharacterized protein n=1 Tax=Eretmocerus hayati TaxID=131215 RepID=A0ACC2NF61_9HYME|nr:hypothetical protein QAD02_001059 [Eretmocerus hayati]
MLTSTSPPLRYPDRIVTWNDEIVNYFEDNFKDNANTNCGIRIKPIARAKYSELTGTRTGSFVNPNIPWLLISLDGIVIGSHTIEIKCPLDGKKESIDGIMGTLSYVETSGPAMDSLDRKHTYPCQVRLCMFLSNLKFCNLVAYPSHENYCGIIRVPYDENELREYLRSLWYVHFCNLLKMLVAADTVSDVEIGNYSPREALTDVTNIRRKL